MGAFTCTFLLATRLKVCKFSCYSRKLYLQSCFSHYSEPVVISPVILVKNTGTAI